MLSGGCQDLLAEVIAISRSPLLAPVVEGGEVEDQFTLFDEFDNDKDDNNDKEVGSGVRFDSGIESDYEDMDMEGGGGGYKLPNFR